MSKRNSSHLNDKIIPKKKKRHCVNLSDQPIINSVNIDEDNKLLDVPDFPIGSKDEIENTIYEAIKRNNISNAKAKYLIRNMLKHPHVVEYFRNIFNSEKPQLNSLSEPRITRSTKRKFENDDDSTVSCLDANLIGRLLLPGPTINSYDFDNDDNNDTDYLPESENDADSDKSSLVSDIGNNKPEEVILSPYGFRSKSAYDDFELDDLDYLLQENIEDSLIENPQIVHESLSLEEMHTLMEKDTDSQLYEEFKQSLFCDDLRNDEADDDSEYDVLGQIDDLDEDILEDFRYDRAAKISRAELWGLLKDNKLVKGNGSSSSNKKTITMLCEDEESSSAEQISSFKDNLIPTRFSIEQRNRLSRQIIMFYQQLATTFIMLYDQPHLKPIIEAQISFYFRIINNIPVNFPTSIFNPFNRTVVEQILFNYKGISYLPACRFNNSILFRKIDFPKCIIATLLSSPAFPYVQLLPSTFKMYNTTPSDYFRQIPFLPTEDKLLTMGIIQFNHQSHKMLKLIKKYLFPIRSTDQLRNRKTNIIRRQKELNHKDSELFAELLQFSGYLHVNKKNVIKVHSELAKLPIYTSSIWQRTDQWKHLTDIYKSFLTKTVPDFMYKLHLCSKDEWIRANRIAANRKNHPTKEFQYCNWTSLPWKLDNFDPITTNDGHCSMKNTLKKVINQKSFPQYEVPKNSKLREFLNQWNCDHENNDINNNHNIKNNIATNTMTAQIKRPINIITANKSIKRAKLILLRSHSKKERTKIQTEQSYAHYFRNEYVRDLFPPTAFKSKLEECIATKDTKNPRLQRFQNKCRDKESDIIDFNSLSFSNQDEVDLVFCRNLLDNLRNNLDTDTYEKCLDKINEFQLNESDSNLDESVIALMEFLMKTVKADPNNIDIYEDLLSLLTFQQAVKLGCEIEWNIVKNVNKLYSCCQSINTSHKRRFWVRLSSLINKSGEGIHSLGKVIQYLHSSVKSNGYLQSLIAPLLNCWEAPFPNFPQAFANFDSLSGNSVLADFSKDCDRDVWEYCSDLAEQPKGPCACNCHANGTNGNIKESSAIRHCASCNLKVYNGCIYLDESKFHKRPVTIKQPDNYESEPPKKDVIGDDNTKISAPKSDALISTSVIEFLKSKNTSIKQLQHRCVTITEIASVDTENKNIDNADNPEWVMIPSISSLPYVQVLENSEAAMDTDLFRQIKGQHLPCDNDVQTNLRIPKFESTVKQEPYVFLPNWSDDDNLLLLTLCQQNGPTNETFAYLQKAHFSDRSIVQIEDQFNYLFQKVLEYQQMS